MALLPDRFEEAEEAEESRDPPREEDDPREELLPRELRLSGKEEEPRSCENLQSLPFEQLPLSRNL